jgi:hypothetical protein
LELLSGPFYPVIEAKNESRHAFTLAVVVASGVNAIEERKAVQ